VPPADCPLWYKREFPGVSDIPSLVNVAQPRVQIPYSSVTSDIKDTAQQDRDAVNRTRMPWQDQDAMAGLGCREQDRDAVGRTGMP
jgi:hypothetical protein